MPAACSFLTLSAVMPSHRFVMAHKASFLQLHYGEQMFPGWLSSHEQRVSPLLASKKIWTVFL